MCCIASRLMFGDERLRRLIIVVNRNVASKDFDFARLVNLKAEHQILAASVDTMSGRGKLVPIGDAESAGNGALPSV